VTPPRYAVRPDDACGSRVIRRAFAGIFFERVTERDGQPFFLVLNAHD
jgi:hypothetical protein